MENNNESNKKKFKPLIIAILIAFIIPFANFIYFIVSVYFGSENNEIIAVLIGFLALFFVVPVLFVVSCLLCFIPAKIYKWKKLVVLSVFLTEIFGFILMVLAIYIGYTIDKYILSVKLNAYTPVIEYLEIYKTENGKYPDKIDKILVSSKTKFKYEEYKSYNNGNGYKLSVGDYENLHQYRHCSDELDEECKPINEPWFQREYINKNWLEDRYVD